MIPKCAYQLGQGNLKERRNAIQQLNKLVDIVEQEKKELRGFIPGNSSGLYLIGISKEPWDSMRVLIGSEEDYSRILNKEQDNELIIGVEI